MDAVKNFGIVEVSTGYNASDTSIALSASEGAKLPQPSTDGKFNLVWWNSTDYADPSDDPNKEIVRVTARSTDTLTVERPVSGNNYNGETSDNTASTKNTASKTYKMQLAFTHNVIKQIETSSKDNILKNGNMINNSTNGYGGTPDDWVNSGGNPVQGGFPEITKQNLIDLLGIVDGDIEAMYALDGVLTDLSSNGYNLTANGTPTDNDDGVMAQAKDLDGATDYLSNPAANANITGAQTWIVLFRHDTSAQGGLMSFFNSGVGERTILVSGNVMYWRNTGLTGGVASDMNSDVLLENGKWYLAVCRKDATNGMQIWINGVNKAETLGGTPDAVTGDLWIGRSGGYDKNLTNFAAIISQDVSDVALDNLWAFLTYSGQKVRRATSDGYIYQTLSESDLARLRGKTVTLRATAQKDTAGTDATIAVYDGANEYESQDLSAADAWEDLSVTVDIPSDASEITIRLKASTTDGNVWFKEVALFEGNAASAYSHSKDDWSRFPRLLNMDIPVFGEGTKPYTFEEKRWYTWTPDFTGFSSDPSSITSKFMFDGENCSIQVLMGGSGTSNASGFTMTGPITNALGQIACLYGATPIDNGSEQSTQPTVRMRSNSRIVDLYKSGNSGSGWTTSGGKRVVCLGGNYPIA